MATETEHQDRLLRCIVCRNEFVFTASEQEFYENKEFPEPKRCVLCRKVRKYEGLFGSRLVTVDIETGHLMCSRCSNYAHAKASVEGKQPLCTLCIGWVKEKEEVSPDDRITLEDWRELKKEPQQ